MEGFLPGVHTIQREGTVDPQNSKFSLPSFSSILALKWLTSWSERRSWLDADSTVKGFYSVYDETMHKTAPTTKITLDDTDITHVKYHYNDNHNHPPLLQQQRKEEQQHCLPQVLHFNNDHNEDNNQPQQ